MRIVYWGSLHCGTDALLGWTPLWAFLPLRPARRPDYLTTNLVRLDIRLT